MTIAYTENFVSFTNPRSYAVYVGVIPFDHSSGTSIRGRKRVSHIANKELKQELNQAARSAMVWDKEMKLYGENKMKTKCYKVVLNNIKFKLILRMFAVVKKGEMYVENYQTAA
jgi:transposase